MKSLIFTDLKNTQYVKITGQLKNKRGTDDGIFISRGKI